MTMRFRARRLLVITLAGMVVVGLGGGNRPLSSWRGGGGLFDRLAVTVGAVVAPAMAHAAVAPRNPAGSSARTDAVSSTTEAKATSSKATTKAKSKRKKNKGKTAKSSARRKHVRGRCEPQSLTYARQRSGIMRSRSGPENGPLTWFASEAKLGKTAVVPIPGSVLILGADRRHGMPTGHVAYVEQVSAQGASTYRVIFSHTNYDRRCSLETNIEAEYDSTAKTLDIYSGAWQVWGKDLKVAGFIEQ